MASYAIVLDAGSSGTRLYMYEWRPANVLRPWQFNIEQIDSWKSGTAITELVRGNPNSTELQTRVNNYLRPFVAQALRHWPKAFFEAHPGYVPPGMTLEDIFPPIVLPAVRRVHERVLPGSVQFSLYATAGVRSMDPRDRDRLMDRVRACREAGIFAGRINSRHISGNEEALFGWLAASYLRNTTAGGYVEMGGVSAQIAFPVREGLNDYAVPAGEAARKVKLSLAPLHESKMFLASYNVGMDKARGQYDQKLFAADENLFRADVNGVPVIHDASKPGTFHGEINGEPVVGASGIALYFTRMTQTVYNLLGPPESPTIGHTPGNIVASLEEFAGGAGFYYSMHRDDNAGLAVDFHQHYRDLCAMKAVMTPNQKKYDLLFKGVWNSQVLRNTFKIETTMGNANTVIFLPLNERDGIELSWTLGQLIFRIGGGALEEW